MSEILDLNRETLVYYKDCFDSNGSKKNLEMLEWQYFENNAENFVAIEYDVNSQKTAAIYATFGVKFKIDGKIYLGSQSLDTMTDINYRGKGLFIKLAKDVYQKATNNNVALVYGFPNGSSIHGFKSKLEWEVLDPLPFLIKPLKSRYFTDKISLLKFLPNINLSFGNYSKSKKYVIREENTFPESVNAIWNSFSKDIKVAVHRDKSYLDWRYISKPFENYKIAHCYDAESRHLGFVIYTVKGKHGGKIAYIMELLYNLEHPQAAKRLLQHAVSKIKKEEADCILTWSLEHSPNASVYKKEFFISLPEKFRPIELHFGVRSFDESQKKVINNRKNWYLSYSDSDTV